MKRTTSAENKTLVIEAFDTLFNKRDYAAAERYCRGQGKDGSDDVQKQ